MNGYAWYLGKIASNTGEELRWEDAGQEVRTQLVL